MAIVKEITAFSKILKITPIFWTLSKVPPPPIRKWLWVHRFYNANFLSLPVMLKEIAVEK